MILTLVTLFIACTYQGTIKIPQGEAAIWNSVANANVKAQYIFNFILETYLSTNSQLEIVFPLQYSSGLGIETNKQVCSPSCSINGRIVSFSFDQEMKNGTMYSVQIQPVVNPINQGGTANFILRTKRGSNIIDENLIFGIIGIAGAIQQMVFGQVVLYPFGSFYAGDYTQYILKFKTVTKITQNSFMLFTVPNEFKLEPFPVCSTYPLNGITLSGSLFCSQVNKTNVVRIDGIIGQIQALQEYALIISMRNPYYAGTSSTFALGLYKANTQMMFEEVKSIPGVVIQAAQLLNVSMSPLYSSFINSQSRLMDYLIKYTPPFPIPTGCNIKIVFPVYMQIVTPTDFNLVNQFQMHYINYGLEDISEDNPIGIYYYDTIQNYLRLTNFKPMTMTNEISITIRVINPSASGYTTPLKLYVYQDLTEYILLQSDVLYGVASVTTQLAGNQNINSPNPAIKNYYNLPRSNFFPNYNDLISTPAILLADQSIIPQLIFNYDPSISIPASAFISIIVPIEFAIVSSITSANCLILQLVAAPGVTAYVNSATCVVVNQKILIEFPSNVGMDVIQFPPSETPAAGANQQRFRLDNIIKTPSLNGTYYFDITIYDRDLITIYDTYSQPIVIQSNTLATQVIKHIPNSFGTKAIFDLEFTTRLFLPSGQPQFRASDLRGFIELHFTVGGLFWASDLGTGLLNGATIPCYGVNSLIPYSGNALKCILRHGSATTPAIVTISNFKEIPPNTRVRLMLSGITNPMADYALTIKLFKKQNRIYTLLNTKSLVTSALTAVTPVTTTCASVPLYSESRVGFIFDLTVQPCFTTNVAGNSYMLMQLPFYDIGLVRAENTITCSISGIQIYCIPLVGSDFILMISPTAQQVASANPLIVISNLQWPRYVEDFTTYSLRVLVITSAGAFQQHLKHATLTKASPSLFDQIITVVPNKGKGFVDSSYKFTFTPQADIPQGSTIILQFPTFYNFLNGKNLPIFGYSGLEDIDTINKVKIQVNIRLIKVSGFKKFLKGKSFILTATGVKHSESYTSSIGFQISAIYLDKFVLFKDDFYRFDFTTPFSAGYIVINQISASIINADEEADYLIQFTPQNDIPIGGLIKITFPTKNYKKLPSKPICRLSGGLSTFKSCTINGNTFIVEINERYKAGNGVISFTIGDVKNPDQGITDGFELITEFEGVNLDITDVSTLNGRTFSSKPKCNLITLNSITFDPKNEGEEAQYEFSFITYSALNSTSEIVFKFPRQYDEALGRDIQCIVKSGLIGAAYKCSAANRVIVLNDFDSYTPEKGNPITVTLFGIVNPNVNEDGSSTDYLKIYVRQVGSNQFEQSNNQVAQLSFQTAPGWSTLLSIDISNFYVRWNATYNFTFQTYKKIPKVGTFGAILMDFPSQFEIPDGSIIGSSSTEFAKTITCVSYRNRIKTTGNFDDYVGLLYVQFKKLINPIEEGNSDFFYIRTYDGLNQKIIERNFANLDPFKYPYAFPGPLIIVNKDSPLYIERGTQQLYIPVVIQYPSLLNLELVPSAQNFTIQPSKVKITLGSTLVYFNISVPQSSLDGKFTIYWTLDKELDPPLYTPVKRSIVYITKKQNTQIIQPSILPLPVLGTSLKTEYMLVNPPDTELQLTLYLQNLYQGIKLDVSQIRIAPGTTKFGFQLLYDKSVNSNGTLVERGFILLSLIGVNKDIFNLQQSSVEFTIISQDTKSASWINAAIVNILKTTAQLSVSLTEPCMVYFLLALKGTVVPTQQDFEKQTIYYSSTQSQYGYIVVTQGYQNFYITIQNLIAETNYVVHLLAVDRGFNVAPQRSLEFITQSRPDSCYFTLIFNRRELNSEYIRNTTDVLSFVLGIDSYYIQQQKYYRNSLRILQNSFTAVIDEIKSYLDLELAAIPNSESFPDPINVIAQISNKTELFTSRLPELNLTLDITAFKFNRYIPKFVSKPEVVFIDYQQCAIQIQLSDYGWGFAVAVVFEQHKQQIPTPYQIMNGLDYQNRPTPHGQIEISQSYQDFIVNINGLESETDYFIYVVGGSIHFRAPDLMDSENIYKDRIISFMSPQKPILNINKQETLSAMVMIMLIIWY